MLELFISSDSEDNVVSTGFTITQDYLPIHSETSLTIFGKTPSDNLIQYHALRQALLFRLKLASEEETFVHCPTPLYAELARLKPPKDPALWAECYGLMHALPRIEPAICQDVRHQRMIAEAVAKLLSQNKPAIPVAPPAMPKELPVESLARLLRTIYPSDFLEELSERLIFG